MHLEFIIVEILWNLIYFALNRYNLKIFFIRYWIFFACYVLNHLDGKSAEFNTIATICEVIAYIQLYFAL